MKRFLFILAAALAFALGACKPSPADVTPAGRKLPTQAQPRLPTIKLWIGAQEMTAEMALTSLQTETGMMFRTNIGPNEGMIFVFPQPSAVSFWMKNTVIPLGAAYIAPDGTIMEIHELHPQDTNDVVAANDNIQFVLETPSGWFTNNHIGVGTVVSTERGSLKKVFLGE